MSLFPDAPPEGTKASRKRAKQAAARKSVADAQREIEEKAALRDAVQPFNTASYLAPDEFAGAEPYAGEGNPLVRHCMSLFDMRAVRVLRKVDCEEEDQLAA